MIEEDGQLDNGETPVILETPEVPNYLPVSTTPLLTSMNQMFFKTEDKKGAVIKAASKFSLAQNSKVGAFLLFSSVECIHATSWIKSDRIS